MGSEPKPSAHGNDQFEFPETEGGLPFPGNRKAREGVHRGEPGQRRSGIIRCGIGDVTEPLPAAVRDAMHEAVDEMGDRETFKGYGPEQGYEFLRKAIAEHDFKARGLDIAADEIFISDGSKCDTGNILDIFGKGNVIAITDPVYPVYVDTNVMAGNTGDADEKRRLCRAAVSQVQRRPTGSCADVPTEKRRPHLSLLTARNLLSAGGP